MPYDILTPAGTPPTGTEITTLSSTDGATSTLPHTALHHPTSGAALIGQAARAASLPITISTEDLAAIASQATVEAIRVLLAAGIDVDVTNQISDFATQTTLAALLSAVQAGVAVTGPQTDAQARATPLPVSGPLTDTQLRANPIAVSGSFTSTGLTDAELRASAVAVSGPLTDAQLRATPIAVSGSFTSTGLTDAELRATPVAVSGTVTASGPLTDAQLRTTAVPVSGPLTDAQIRATPLAVIGPQTDAEARATPLPVSLATIPLATDAATQTTLATLATQTTAAAILSALQGVIDVDVTNQISGFATQTTLEAARVILAAIQAAVEGTVTVDGTVGISGTVTVNGSAVTQPVSGTFWQTTQPVSLASSPLPTGAATEATLAGGVGLRPDLDGDEQSGTWALSATPGTVTSITLPDAARIATVYAPSDVRVRLNADPAAVGSGAFAAGSPVPAFERRAFLLEPGTSRTLRVRSTVASVAVTVEVRP